MAYTLINDSYVLTLFSVKGLNSYVLTSIIGAEHPLNGPSPLKMISSENLISNLKLLSKSLPRIIPYLLLVDLAT